MAGWTQLTTPANGHTPTPSPVEAHETVLLRSPLMHAAMPLMASTADAFVRQFYSTGNLPQNRILPAKKTP
jgi:hypothetical protein